MTKPNSKRWAEVSPYLDQALELDPREREPCCSNRNPAISRARTGARTSRSRASLSRVF
jgi:hypothetical protein